MTTAVWIMSMMENALALGAILALTGIGIALACVWQISKTIPGTKVQRQASNVNVRRDVVEFFMRFVRGAFSGVGCIAVFAACIAALSFVVNVWEESQKFAHSQMPWKMVVATGSTPVSLAYFASREGCEAERTFRIKEAYEVRQNIPTLECLATVSWGERLQEGWRRTHRRETAIRPHLRYLFTYKAVTKEAYPAVVS
jgi:hypothetical protein